MWLIGHNLNGKVTNLKPIHNWNANLLLLNIVYIGYKFVKICKILKTKMKLSIADVRELNEVEDTCKVSILQCNEYVNTCK